MKKSSSLKGLKNIGPTIALRLHEVGVNSRQDLEALGPVKAFLKIKAAYPHKTIPVCYYLYSLEGALRNQHWDDLPERVKTN